METIAKQALEIVEELNDQLYENDGLEYNAPFEFKSMGWYSSVYFMGICIWDSDCDDRDYIGDTDEQEPLRDFLIKEAKYILKDLNNKMSVF